MEELLDKYKYSWKFLNITSPKVSEEEQEVIGGIDKYLAVSRDCYFDKVVAEPSREEAVAPFKK